MGGEAEYDVEMTVRIKVLALSARVVVPPECYDRGVRNARHVLSP